MAWDVGTIASVVALIVSLIALLISLGSLLGQYFATADGYRRCQSSVMGPWAKLTRRRWLTNELRFDTLFSTPGFFVEKSPDQCCDSRTEHQINGSEGSLEKTLTPPPSSDGEHFDLVSWIHFLQALHEESKDIYPIVVVVGQDDQTTFPALRQHQKSWDFMPPDVVRPLASSTLADICILARRLGMVWKECRPFEGAMTGEGRGRVIKSTTVRGVGIVLQYTHLGSGSTDQERRYIWNSGADKMGFGILPGNTDFRIPDFHIGTPPEVFDVLNEIDPSKKASTHVQTVMGRNPGWPTAFCDFIPLAAPMLRSRGSSRICVPAPGAQEIASGPSVLTCVQFGFKAFKKRLEEMRTVHESRQLTRVWKLYSSLLDKHNQVWEDDSVESTDRSLQFLDDVHDSYDETTDYFKLLEKDNPPFRYYNLVKAHITHAVFFWPESQQNVESHRARENFWRAEGMHVYFDYLPKYAQSMKDSGFDNEALVREAWVTLMFRAFCWQRCHFMVRGPTVPSMYYDSYIPVYMG